VRIYPYFYRFLQNFISIGKQEQNFFTQIEKLLLDKKSNYKCILDVGCADGIFLEKVNIPRSIKYVGIDLESVLIKKANFKYKKKNIKFICQSIENININNYPKKTLIIMCGVVHHLPDNIILNFMDKLGSRSIICLDGFYNKKQSQISRILLFLDKGKFIRTLIGYKKILKNFYFIKKINKYLLFYSHLISYKNINNNLIKSYFGNRTTF
jgi:2-polyprenyl-3-methyl-5-hydroxy-6-metoxy-1,4-benzoquinol methylase